MATWDDMMSIDQIKKFAGESFLHDYHIDEEENSETYESTQKQYAKI